MGRAEGYESEWSMDEVCDTHYQAKGWVKLDGSSPAFKHAVTVEAGEILQVCRCLSGRRLPWSKPWPGESVHIGAVQHSFLTLLLYSFMSGALSQLLQ